MSKEHRHRAESHVTKTLCFIGEQDGIPEREFKIRIVPLLARSGIVERCYLARVAYGSVPADVVALCLLAERPQDVLLREIGAVFASMFGRDQHLDILCIDRDQEQKLARVCPPFFESIT